MLVSPRLQKLTLNGCLDLSLMTHGFYYQLLHRATVMNSPLRSIDLAAFDHLNAGSSAGLAVQWLESAPGNRLESIRLSPAFRSRECLVAVGNLKNLRHLDLSLWSSKGMEAVGGSAPLGDSRSSQRWFPSLRSLVVQPGMTHVISDLNDVPRLGRLKIVDRDKKVITPSTPFLQAIGLKYRSLTRVSIAIYRAHNVTEPSTIGSTLAPLLQLSGLEELAIFPGHASHVTDFHF